MEQIEAPTLFKAFYKIRPKSLDYCCVCLRTGSERRLVKPRTYKKFIEAVSTGCVFSEKNQVCYMCERQASSAYKFYKAAMFATSVQQFLCEYLQRRGSGGEAAERRRMRQLLRKKESAWARSLVQWESQLLAIRSSTELLHTEVLVIDSSAAQSLSPCKSPPLLSSLAEVYIVPDEPHHPLHTAHPHTQDTVILIDEDEDNQEIKTNHPKNGPKPGPKCGPKLVPIQKLLDQPRIQSKEIIFEGDQLDPLTLAPSTDQLVTPASTTPSVSNFVTTLPNRTPSNGLSEQLADKITPSSVMGVNDNYILHPIVLDKDGNLTVPSLGSNLINNFIQMPQIGNNVIQINNTDGNLNLVNNNVFQLPQTNSNNNIFQIPQANNLNIQIPNNNFVQIPQIPNSFNVNANNQVFQIQVVGDDVQPNLNMASETITQSNVRTEHLKQINNLANEIITEMESHNNDSKVKKSGTNTSSNFGIKRPSNEMNPVIKNVHAVDKKKKIDEVERDKATKRSERIDWEDKIPMDVISFVDAIDPNANQLLKTPESPQYAISHVRSLSTDNTRKSKRNVSHVIDLC